MPFVSVVVDGKEVARRESTFGDDSWSKEVSDTLNGKNLVVKMKTSRQRRKEKNNGDV